MPLGPYVPGEHGTSDYNVTDLAAAEIETPGQERARLRARKTAIPPRSRVRPLEADAGSISGADETEKDPGIALLAFDQQF